MRNVVLIRGGNETYFSPLMVLIPLSNGFVYICCERQRGNIKIIFFIYYKLCITRSEVFDPYSRNKHWHPATRTFGFLRIATLCFDLSTTNCRFQLFYPVGYSDRGDFLDDLASLLLYIDSSFFRSY